LSYVTTHAKERLRSRWGLELSFAQWKVIAEQAAEGTYEQSPDWAGDLVEPLLLIPVGPPDGDTHFIPMVIDINLKLVITVYPPRK